MPPLVVVFFVVLVVLWLFVLFVVFVFVVFVVVILVILAAVFLFGGSGVAAVTTNKTLSLNVNQAENFQIGTSKTQAAIFLSNSTNGSAVIYIGKMPVLLSPSFKFTLHTGQAAG